MSVPAFEEFEPMLTEEVIRHRVRELGDAISRDYEGQEIIVVGVLKGAAIFMSDLIRGIRVPLSCDFLRVSSYEGTESKGMVRWEFDLTQSITGQNVILIEDIVDTGLTAHFLLKSFELRKPKSLKFCTLLHKPDKTKTELRLDYVGFSIPNRFVIGYGLDLDGKYRNLPYIAALRDS